MTIFKDILSFIEYLSFVDIVFLVAIVVLLILVVTLIYFIKINNEMINNHVDTKKDNTTLNEVMNTSNVHNEMDKLDINIEEEQYNDEDAELLDLKSLTKKLEENNSKDRISFTEYEKDQEDKAIISYDELINKKNKYAINYEKEEMIDDLLVKKVNLNDLVNKNEVIEEKSEDVRVISYQKEEAFLNALKELNSLLN